MSIALLAYGLLCFLVLRVMQQIPGMISLASITGIYLALQASSLWGPLKISGPIKFIGRNTLPIFILHPLILKGVNLIFENYPTVPAWIYARETVVAGYPLLMIVAVVVICLLIERLARLTGSRFLFSMPKSF